MDRVVLVPAALESTFSASPLEYCRQLEVGNILLFPQSPIALAEEDLHFLRGLEHSHRSLHKNLAYKPLQDRLAGAKLEPSDPAARARLLRILRGYSHGVLQFLAGFLRPYAERWQIDYASFRPLEEQGRALPLHKRNDLLHTDAFPTRPTQGARILRFFTNIHPTQPRQWRIGEPFRTLAPQYFPAKIPLPCAEETLQRMLRTRLSGTPLGMLWPALRRSHYDRCMLRFHDALKEDAGYQASGRHTDIALPPGSSWMVYTDSVPHAVLSGKFVLEQTLLIAAEAMTMPEESPLAVLESLAGCRLV
jgi:hypothetical protein